MNKTNRFRPEHRSNETIIKPCQSINKNIHSIEGAVMVEKRGIVQTRSFGHKRTVKVTISFLKQTHRHILTLVWGKASNSKLAKVKVGLELQMS